MMAPYAIGHLKMSFLLEELGYRLQKDDRVKLYLTNTLEMEELAATNLPGMKSLSEESHLAGKVKKEQPILVILGNPPYSVSSVNKSEFIEQEMNVYKEDVRTERNIQPLSDDYMKFIRFAHWKIEQDGKGIVGMITNNSYLSGLIHRGMRKKLIDSFDEIYILNLHGNSRIGEKAPDGSKDENVFDIQQGVSIVLFIKQGKKGKGCRVFYQDVHGLRESKYDYLSKSDLHKTKWTKLNPSDPYYFFVEKDFSLQAKYDKFIAISEIFDKSAGGIKTHRDHLVIGFTDEEIKQRMRTFTSSLPDDLIAQSLELKGTTDFELGSVRESVRKINWKEHIRPYSYRPFDSRSICYLSNLIDRDRMEIMHNFFNDNLGLVTMRQYVYDSVKTYNYAFCTKDIIDNRFFISNRGICSIFPLYIYKENNKPKNKTFSSAMMLFEPEAEYGVKKPNLSPDVLERLIKAYKKVPSPEEIFYYIYAVLYSETYRTKYAEFLKIDFPRVPFTKDYKLFKKMSELGNRLVNLHLLKSQELDSPITQFQVEGNNRVEKPKYEQPPQSPLTKGELQGRVYINKEQYFEGISPEIWNYQIGGYQVCDKWLKDRKERILTLDEIQTYCRIVTAIEKTIDIQKKIDGTYLEVEGQTI